MRRWRPHFLLLIHFSLMLLSTFFESTSFPTSLLELSLFVSCFGLYFLLTLYVPLFITLPLAPFPLSLGLFLTFWPPSPSPCNSFLSSLCSPLMPNSERPISLHRGFTSWGCEGKPKWNAAHLLEWNQDGFSSITPYAPPALLLLQQHCTKKPQNASSRLVVMCVCTDFSLPA